MKTIGTTLTIRRTTDAPDPADVELNARIEASMTAGEKAVEEHLDQLLDEDSTERQRAARIAREWLTLNPLFVDTETTGLEDDAEIVSIAVVDAAGNALLDTFVKPSQPIPPEATAIHGITNEMVEHAQTFAQLFPALSATLRDRTLILWNADFDSRMIRQSARTAGIQDGRINAECAMELYAPFYGDWDKRRDTYRWQTLGNAAMQCGLKVRTTELHSARTDADVCRQIVQYMATCAT